MKDNFNVVFDMAKSNGVGRLVVGHSVIPVKVVDIKHETTIDSHETEFRCLAVDASAAYVDTDSITFDPLRRNMGKWREEYDAMKRQLEAGFSIVPVKGTRGGWATRSASVPSGPCPWGWGIPGIDKVIFNNPATIVFWTDGEKTVVKAQNDEPYDPEKGLAMAITKRALGNKGNYCNVLKKWTDTYEDKTEVKEFIFPDPNAIANNISGAVTTKIDKVADIATEFRNAMNEVIENLKKDDK